MSCTKNYCDFVYIYHKSLIILTELSEQIAQTLIRVISKESCGFISASF